MSNANKLKIKTHKEQDTLVVHFDGVIDEDADLDVVDVDPVKTIIFDFDGLKGVNSCGLRTFILFLAKVNAQESGKKLIYRHCHSNLLDQLTMLPRMMQPGTEIQRPYLDYVCEGCDSHSEIVVESKDKELPEVTCQDCGKAMEIDDVFIAEFLEVA